MKILISLGLVLFAQASLNAHPGHYEKFEHKTVLADLPLLRMLKIPVMYESKMTNVGYAVITPEMQYRMHEANHRIGRCGVFEVLDEDTLAQRTPQNILESLEAVQAAQNAILPLDITVEKNENIVSAINEVSPERLQKNVEWFASFPNRYNKSPEPNKFGDQFVLRLKELLANSKVPYEIDMIPHKSTPQNSIRVRLPGRTRPEEIIALGGHMDSINQDSWSSNMIAPGADDNASGSSNLIEALQIVSQGDQAERTIEFFWYAGEESGLLGSAEIAKAYKAENKKVVGVLQLDMTLFPGSGEFVLGSMTDFTSLSMREYLKQINATYIGGKIVDDKCGYGCSDHASWFRQGFPTIMPFESTFKGANSKIHTTSDVISSTSNFKHSAMFSKIAVALAMD
ncbi:MAG: M20/M25/M40 family metallo-hydrolase, partial [Pseudobdellovibrionaceae bacterium]